MNVPGTRKLICDASGHHRSGARLAFGQDRSSCLQVERTEFLRSGKLNAKGILPWNHGFTVCRSVDDQIGQLDREMASLRSTHQDAVQRLAEIPGLGVDSTQQIIAEVGPTAATFPSAKCLASWVGTCPGEEESAGVNYSHRSPK